MGFFHYRIKKYIEIRIADAVPVDKALGYAALIKGLIYNSNGLEKLNSVLEDVKCIDDIIAATEAVERFGYDAMIYDNRTAGEWCDEIIDIAAQGIDEAEVLYLNMLRRNL